MEVPADEIRAAAREVPRDVREAIATAARHIRRVAARQVPGTWSIEPVRGVRIAQRVLPLDRVGCYVPGGRYPLPSSLLMTAIPARVAGVPEVVAVCPRPDATIMCAAREAGVSRLFRLGGAHAVAALAYGTATVPRVDKIVGPGNAYVAAAKALVSFDCAIDFHAGPSEIAIVSAGRTARLDRRGSHRAGRARSGRTRHPVHAVARAARTPSRASCDAQMPEAGPGAARHGAQRRASC